MWFILNAWWPSCNMAMRVTVTTSRPRILNTSMHCRFLSWIILSSSSPLVFRRFRRWVWFLPTLHVTLVPKIDSMAHLNNIFTIISRTKGRIGLKVRKTVRRRNNRFITFQLLRLSTKCCSRFMWRNCIWQAQFQCPQSWSRGWCSSPSQISGANKN